MEDWDREKYVLAVGELGRNLTIGELGRDFVAFGWFGCELVRSI
jgi:hypothetical protein